MDVPQPVRGGRRGSGADAASARTGSPFRTGGQPWPAACRLRRTSVDDRSAVASAPRRRRGNARLRSAIAVRSSSQTCSTASATRSSRRGKVVGGRRQRQIRPDRRPHDAGPRQNHPPAATLPRRRSAAPDDAHLWEFLRSSPRPWWQRPRDDGSVSAKYAAMTLVISRRSHNGPARETLATARAADVRRWHRRNDNRTVRFPWRCRSRARRHRDPGLFEHAARTIRANRRCRCTDVGVHVEGTVRRARCRRCPDPADRRAAAPGSGRTAARDRRVRPSTRRPNAATAAY